ncbi:cytochrome c oxidase subunit 4 [Aestuariimicrobium ganziense]|uniref:cytochrome c oxidase subunit 4 n=1 Tax=Aestuariimicrobium ganziense TaxID=2773677 RepID=UPI001944684D|nr:cytochrome c oxidase subunit 4 [Aestuariimicrobium ganziense]
MRAEAWIFIFLAAFFLVVTAVYWFMTYEVVGTVALLLSTLLSSMVFVYLLLVGKEVGKRPEDDHDAEIHEAAGELGFFPPKSIWPFWLSLCITLLFVGIVFGWWISAIGFGLGVWALSGLVFEYYRGDYAH